MEIEVGKLFGPACVDYDEGTILYEHIIGPLRAGEDVELDFAGVSVFASPFFNASLARLVKDFAPEELNRRLHLPNLNEAGKKTARRSIENAKKFYSDPERAAELDECLRAELERESA